MQYGIGFQTIAIPIIGERPAEWTGIHAQIAQNKYDNALALAGLEQRLTSKMDQNEITSLRDQIQQLQLNQAMCGVVRYPQGWAYNAGPFPPVVSTTTA